MSADTDIVEAVITAPPGDWLLDFTRDLVRDGLAACGHHMPIRSIYTWNGQLEDEDELRVALHTRANLVEEIFDRLHEHHPYDVPCLLTLPVVGGNPAYLDWVRAQTRDG